MRKRLKKIKFKIVLTTDDLVFYDHIKKNRDIIEDSLITSLGQLIEGKNQPISQDSSKMFI